MYVVGQLIAGDLSSVDFFAGPTDNAGNEPRLAAGLSRGKQCFVLLILEVFDAVQFGVLLLEIGRDHKGRLPVFAQAFAD